MPSTLTHMPAASAPRSVPSAISWRSWPIGHGGRALAWWTATILLVGLTVGYVTGRGDWMLLAVGLVTAAAWRLFVPVEFELGALGVIEHRGGQARRAAWSAVDHAWIGRQGVFLSLYDARCSAFRGIYLPWEQQRDQVLAIVEYYLPASRRTRYDEQPNVFVGLNIPEEG